MRVGDNVLRGIMSDITVVVLGLDNNRIETPEKLYKNDHFYEINVNLSFSIHIRDINK